MTIRVLGVIWATILASPAFAQSSVSEVLNFLVTNQSIETGSGDRDRAAAQATSDAISRSLLTHIATLPITSSSAGFVYRLDPALGTVARQSSVFGPVFVERGMGVGRGSASVGLTFQHLRFGALDGRSLREGSLVTTANRFVDEAEPFDADRLALRIDADIATAHANFGVSDLVDIGVAVPFVALRVGGSRVNTYRGQTFTQATASATALGVADVLVRGKVTAYRDGPATLAAAADLRLPTGRQRDLLGAGATSVKVTAIGSLERRRISSDVNLGMSFGGLARELSYSGALVGAATERVTLIAEVVGRWIDTPGRFGALALPHPTLAGVETIRLRPARSTTKVLAFSPGLKWNVSDTWVMVVSLTIPLTDGGLTAPWTPLLGADYGLQ